MDDLIFDRSQADIDFAMTLRQANLPIPLADSLKFSYDHRALNRVENYISHLVDYIRDFGFDVEIPVKTWWTKEDQISFEDSKRYMANLKELAEALGADDLFPSVLDSLSYMEANHIERFLHGVEPLLDQLAPLFSISGTVSAGQASHLPHFV